MKKPIIVGFWIAILLFSAIAIPVLAQTVLEDFEDGNTDNWTNMAINSTIVYEGDFSGKHSGGGFELANYNVPVSNNPANYTMWWYEHESDDGYKHIVWLQKNAGVSGPLLATENNNVYARENQAASPGTLIESNVINEGHWYKIRFQNMSVSTDSYDIRMFNSSSGNLVASANDISYFESSNQFDSINTITIGATDSGSTVFVDYMSVNESQSIDFTPTPSPTPTPPPSNLHLNINNQWMDHNTKQIFNVEFVNGTAVSDVTQEATVQSSQPNNITVFQANETLLSTDNESINTVVTINASYQGHNDSVDIFVGNRTLENIEKCIGFTKIICGIGVDEPNNFGGLGSAIQWIYLIILFATGIGGAFKNPWIGLGMMILGIVLLFIIGEIDLGTTIASVLLGVYFGLVLSQGESITVENFG